MTQDTRSELFLSCDLVNSTAYKQRTAPTRADAEGDAHNHGPWQQTFLEFYHDFPKMLAEIREAELGQIQLDEEPEFSLWKPIGDELVFSVPVAHERTVYAAVRIWIRAIEAWGQRMKPLGMGTKGGAFIATFPGPDRDVAVPRRVAGSQSGRGVVAVNEDACSSEERDHDKYVHDYFGPSVDTGFRVFSKATPRHFTLSVEVAWSMFHASLEERSADYWDADDIRYLGGHELKGVWNARDYPLFAIDRHAGDHVNKAVKRMVGEAVDPDHAQSLCRACVEAKDWPSAIYLGDSEFAPFKVRPVDPLADLLEDNHMVGSEEQPEGDAEELADDDLRPSIPMGKGEKSTEDPFAPESAETD